MNMNLNNINRIACGCSRNVWYEVGTKFANIILMKFWNSLWKDVKHGLRVSESRVLRKIFAPKSAEVVGNWRILHNEEFKDLYFLPNTIWVIK
jgi:hypothetical protein